MAKAKDVGVVIDETAKLLDTEPSPPSLKEQLRNERGLLSDVEYVFNADGTINWRAMIPTEFLVANERVTKEKDVTKLADHQLLILLGGIKWLAHVRGFTKVQYRPIAARVDYFATVCSVDWIGNYETQNSPRTFESLADASERNTEGFATDYLAAIAENRAFVRAVRNFLRINIVSKEELKNTKPDESAQILMVETASDPHSILGALMVKANLTLEKIKLRLIKDGNGDAANYTAATDIPVPIVFELIDRITTKLDKKKKS